MELGLSLGDAAGSSKAFELMEKSHTHTHTSSNKGIGFCMELSIGPTSSVRENGDDDNRRQTQEDEDQHHHYRSEDKQTTTSAAKAEAANIIQQLDLLPNTPVPRNLTPSSFLAAFPAANWTSAGQMAKVGFDDDANKLPATLDLLFHHDDDDDDEDSSSPEAEDGEGVHGAGASSSSSPNANSSGQMDFCIYSSNNHHSHHHTSTTAGTNNIKKSCSRDVIFEASDDNNNNNEVADGCSEPDDENGCSTRKKLRLSKQQSAFLEDSFKLHTTLMPKQKVALAKQLNLRPRQVEVWFQNRRARTKLKQTEVDCEYLKRCCETLTEENRRLQKELQELRALKSTTCNNINPFYMQLPATTLTMCPSCERLATNSNPPPLPTTTTTPPEATSTGLLPLNTRPMFFPSSHHKPTATKDGQI